MTVWISVDRSKPAGDPEHLKVFASEAAADRWFAENDQEGVAFKYEVDGRSRRRLLDEPAVDRQNRKDNHL